MARSGKEEQRNNLQMYAIVGLVSLIIGGGAGLVGGSGGGLSWPVARPSAQPPSDEGSRNAEAFGDVAAALKTIAEAQTWTKERKPLLERFAAIDRALDAINAAAGTLDEKYKTLREAATDHRALWGRVLINERDIKAMQDRERAYLFRKRK